MELLKVFPSKTTGIPFCGWEIPPIWIYWNSINPRSNFILYDLSLLLDQDTPSIEVPMHSIEADICLADLEWSSSIGLPLFIWESSSGWCMRPLKLQNWHHLVELLHPNIFPDVKTMGDCIGFAYRPITVAILLMSYFINSVPTSSDRYDRGPLDQKSLSIEKKAGQRSIILQLQFTKNQECSLLGTLP